MFSSIIVRVHLFPLHSQNSNSFITRLCSLTHTLAYVLAKVLTVVGPGLNAFVTRSSTADPMKTIYIPFSISDPCVFHGLLLLSARSYAETSGDITYHITALTHKSECIRLVNEALGIPGRATSDAIIAAVLMLAVEEVSAAD
jgi:Fungal specific transcription factor domain